MSFEVIPAACRAITVKIIHRKANPNTSRYFRPSRLMNYCFFALRFMGFGYFLGGRGSGNLAFPHPLDDHFIDPFQSGMFCFGGRAPGTRLSLRLGRDGLWRMCVRSFGHV